MPDIFSNEIDWDYMTRGSQTATQEPPNTQQFSPNVSQKPPSFGAKELTWEYMTKPVEKEDKSRAESFFQWYTPKGPDIDSLYFGVGRQIQGTAARSLDAMAGYSRAAMRFRERAALAAVKRLKPEAWEEIQQSPEVAQALQDYSKKAFGGAVTQKIDNVFRKAHKQLQAAQEINFAPRSTEEEVVGVGVELLKYIGLNTLFPGSGGVVSGLEGGGQDFNRALDRLEARGITDPDQELRAMGASTVSGVIQGWLEKVNLGHFDIKWTPKLKNKVFNWVLAKAAQTGVAANSEGLTEALQGATSELMQFILEQDPSALKGFWKRRGKEYAVGVGAGGAAKVGTTAIGAVGELEAEINGRKFQQAYEQADEVQQTPDGFEKLEALTAIEKPSRKDFKDAGIDVPLNAAQRQEFKEQMGQIIQFAKEDFGSVFGEGSQQDVEGDVTAPDLLEAPTTEGEVEAEVEPAPRQHQKTPEWMQGHREKLINYLSPVLEEAKALQAKDPDSPLFRDYVDEIENVSKQIEDTTKSLGDQRPAEYRAMMRDISSLLPGQRLRVSERRMAQPAQTPEQVQAAEPRAVRPAKPVVPAEFTPPKPPQLKPGEQSLEQIQEEAEKRPSPELARLRPQDFTEVEQERRVAEMTPEQIADEMAAIEGGQEAIQAPVQEQTTAQEEPVSPSEQVTEQPDTPKKSAKESVTSFQDSLTKAFVDIDKRKVNYAKLADLRKALPQYTREEFDEEVQRLRKEGVLELSTAEYRGVPPKEEIDAAIIEHIGDRKQKLVAASFKVDPRKAVETSTLPESMQPEFRTGDYKTTIPDIAKEESGAAVPGAFVPDSKHIFKVREDAKELGRKLKTLAKKELASAGLLPSGAYSAQEKARARKASEIGKIRFATAKFYRAARQEYGRNKLGQANISEEDLGKMNAVLAGEADITTVPEKMRTPLAEFRHHLTALSRTAQAEGVVEGALAETFIENEGTYLHRAYRVHDDPKHWKKVDEKVRNGAKNYIRQAFPDYTPEQIDRTIEILLYEGKAADGIIATAGKHDISSKDLDILKRRLQTPKAARDLWDAQKSGQPVTPEVMESLAKTIQRSSKTELSDDQVSNIIGALIQTQNTSSDAADMVYRASKVLSGPEAAVLKSWKDIPKEIRALWGEYKDPVVNYVKSAEKLASLISTHQFLTDVRKDGLGKYLFEDVKKDKNAPKEAKVRIAADGSDVWAPLNGLWTTPEIRDAFVEATKQDTLSKAWRTYYQILGTTKYAKTVASLQTQVRNAISNQLFAVAQGHFNVRKFREAFYGTTAGLLKLDDSQWNKRFLRYVELGVVGDGAISGEIRNALRDASKTEFDDLFGRNWVKAARKAVKGATDLYQAGDDFWKIYAFENERARYREAFKNWSDAEVDAYAANVVRNTYPTYSKIPKFAQRFRRSFLVGPFVSFPAEVIRVGGNTITQIQEDLSRPETRAIGAQRLAGSLMAASATGAAAAMSRHLVGMLARDEDDLRYFLAPWNKASQFIFTKIAGDGNFRLFDLSYADPFNYMRKPIIAFLKGEDWERSLTQSAAELLSPFVSPELMTKRLDEVFNNKAQNDKKVYFERDPWAKKAGDIFDHLADPIEPGLVTSLSRIYKGATGYVSPSGKQYNTLDEVLALLLGIRNINANVRQSMSIQANQLTSEMQESASRINKLLTSKGTVSDREKKRTYELAEGGRKEAFNDLSARVNAAVRLTRNLDGVRADMRKQGINEEKFEKLLTGEYTPWLPQDIDVAYKLWDIASPEHRIALAGHIDKKVGVLASAASGKVNLKDPENPAVKAARKLRALGITRAHASKTLQDRWKEIDQRALDSKRPAAGLDPKELKKYIGSKPRGYQLARLNKIFNILEKGAKNE